MNKKPVSAAETDVSLLYPKQPLTGGLILPKTRQVFVPQLAEARHVHVVLDVQQLDARPAGW